MVSITQNLGRIIPISRDKFKTNVQYVGMDEVIYGFNIYRARKNIAIPTGTLPTDTTYWQKVTGFYSEELCLVDKYEVTLTHSKAIQLDNGSYDRIEVDLNLQLSGASLIYVDTKFGDISTFPNFATYDAGNYTTDDNYDEVYFDVRLRDFNSTSRKTRAIGRGTGFNNGAPFTADTVWEAADATETNAINIVALNGVTMTGSIVVKKYKYLLAV